MRQTWDLNMLWWQQPKIGRLCLFSSLETLSPPLLHDANTYFLSVLRGRLTPVSTGAVYYRCVVCQRERELRQKLRGGLSLWVITGGFNHSSSGRRKTWTRYGEFYFFFTKWYICTCISAKSAMYLMIKHLHVLPLNESFSNKSWSALIKRVFFSCSRMFGAF